MIPSWVFLLREDLYTLTTVVLIVAVYLALFVRYKNHAGIEQRFNEVNSKMKNLKRELRK